MCGFLFSADLSNILIFHKDLVNKEKAIKREWNNEWKKKITSDHEQRPFKAEKYFFLFFLRFFSISALLNSQFRLSLNYEGNAQKTKSSKKIALFEGFIRWPRKLIASLQTSHECYSVYSTLQSYPSIDRTEPLTPQELSGLKFGCIVAISGRRQWREA